MTTPIGSKIRIEIAPGADLDADPATWSWTDISEFGRASEPVEIQFGRADETGHADTAQCTVRLDNRDGRFSSRNPLGPWFGQLGLGTPLRVSWTDPETVRFAGLISELPTRWDITASDSTSPVRADGITRRMQQGEQALNSALYRAISTHPNVVAYWPCEDGDDSSEAASPLAGVAPFSMPGTDFAAVDGPPGSDRLLRVVTDTPATTGRVPNHTPGDVYVVQVAWRMDEDQAASRHILNVHTTSSNRARWLVRITATTFNLQAWDEDDSLVVDETEARNDALFGQWVRAEFRWNASGNSAAAALYTADLAAIELNSVSTTAAGSAGRIVAAGVGGASGQAVWQQDRFFGHLSVLTGTATELPLQPDADRHAPFHGFTGELAADRFERLCEEEGLSCSVIAPTGGLELPGATGSNATTPDSAAFDITGDIDVCAWVTPDAWAIGLTQHVWSRWEAAGDERSWHLRINSSDGIAFAWTTDGTTGTQSNVLSPALVPSSTDGMQLAIRGTLDVDNGASQHVVTLYTGPSLDGPWTVVHSETLAGTTSVHAGAADLYVGANDFNEEFAGRVRAARLYDGIDGTLVASPDFQAQEVGATSFEDAQGNTWTVNGDAAIVRTDDTAAMGAQRPKTLTSLLGEIRDADQAILGEVDFGLSLRTRRDMYNQAAALALSITDGELSQAPEPTDDDQQIRNDVTVERIGGSSARVVDQAHIDAHGRYSNEVSINIAGDGFLPDQASWRLHRGTVDEYRWPRIDIALHADPDLIPDWLALRIGDRLTVDHEIAQILGVEIDLIVEGWTERLDQFNWDVTINASPASPFTVAVFNESRYDTAGSELDSAATDSATSIDVLTTVLPHWTEDDDETPFDIAVGGERITVTDIGAETADVQTFTVTRSVNSVVKSHAAGTPVRLWQPAVYAL